MPVIMQRLETGDTTLIHSAPRPNARMAADRNRSRCALVTNAHVRIRIPSGRLARSPGSRTGNHCERAASGFCRSSSTWATRCTQPTVHIGAQLFTFALLPDGIGVLRVLNRPLNAAPATDTMLFALRTYAGVDVHAGRLFGAFGLLLLVCGFVMCRRAGRNARVKSWPAAYWKRRTRHY